MPLVSRCLLSYKLILKTVEVHSCKIQSNSQIEFNTTWLLLYLIIPFAFKISKFIASSMSFLNIRILG